MALFAQTLANELYLIAYSGNAWYNLMVYRKSFARYIKYSSSTGMPSWPGRTGRMDRKQKDMKWNESQAVWNK